ncbi:DUF402 domain-containing protein [Streptomyces viridifaciens]|nr:DUF402 domain-containing protein [Streptomyces viridifaciens]
MRPATTPPEHVPGQVLRWNFHFGGQLTSCLPMRVVECGPDGLLLWLAAGSPLWKAELPDGQHIRDIPPESHPAGGYPMVAGEWDAVSALIHQPAGEPYAVWWIFEPGSGFSHWYVNLERREYRGEEIDVHDLELDLEVDAERRWRWKDEESFAAKTGHPAFWSAAQARAIRAGGEAVARLVEAGAFPFDGTHRDFAPPADWPLPPLPARP